MKLYSWNVNGIRAVINKGTFQTFIAEHQPDVLCLQETKAKEGQAVIDLPEYHEYWNSADKAGYSGTAIFSKEKPLSVIKGFTDELAKKYGLEGDSYGDPSKEGRVISAEFTDFWVVTVYTPNSKGDLTKLTLPTQNQILVNMVLPTKNVKALMRLKKLALLIPTVQPFQIKPTPIPGGPTGQTPAHAMLGGGLIIGSPVKAWPIKL